MKRFKCAISGRIWTLLPKVKNQMRRRTLGWHLDAHGQFVFYTRNQIRYVVISGVRMRFTNLWSLQRAEVIGCWPTLATRNWWTTDLKRWNSWDWLRFDRNVDADMGKWHTRSEGSDESSASCLAPLNGIPASHEIGQKWFQTHPLFGEGRRKMIPKKTQAAKLSKHCTTYMIVMDHLHVLEKPKLFIPITITTDPWPWRFH